jgi:antitoxin YefM
MPAITATTPTNLRKNLFSVLDTVTEDDTQVIVTMKSGKNAVLISEDELNSYRKAEFFNSIESIADEYDEFLKELVDK